MYKLNVLLIIMLLGINACTSSTLPDSTTTSEPAPTSTEIVPVTLTATEKPVVQISSTPKTTQVPSLTPLSTASSSITSVPQLIGPYLGQDPPGLVPEIFAPGIISDPAFVEYSGAFSPDGNEYYFYRFSQTSEAGLLFSKVINGKWSIPEQLAITAEYRAYEPYVSMDNQRLYFASEYPVPAGQPPVLYFFVERIQNGWSEPQLAGQGMFLSSSLDGQLYTTDMSSRAVDGKTFLAKITISDGVFTDYERLNIVAPWGNPAHPCIALDGSYILFDVNSGNYLFISFKNADGTWGAPIDLTKYGFDRKAGGAYISPDGKYLFFSLNQDIWWVDIKVIENLRTPN
jgi:hypothetical protein